ncbi:MAG: EMC3/TMCO1 family protein [Candidatus Hydrothermarchaeales archaeon]
MVFTTIAKPFFGLMDLIFGPFFHLTSNQEINRLFGILIISTIVSFFIMYVTAKVVDQKQMKRYKKRLEEYQKQVNKLQKKGDTKRLQQVQRKMMQIQGEMMKSAFAPMIYTMFPIIIIFGWLHHIIPREVVVVNLPFSLPRYGTTLGWLGWYIFCSFPTSSLIKKLMNIETP